MAGWHSAAMLKGLSEPEVTMEVIFPPQQNCVYVKAAVSVC
jgi:hypothetical protein